MKKTLSRLFILCLITLYTSKVLSQVTIGSTIAPNKGALLDLKDATSQASPVGGVTAKKGMALPRVELKNKTALTMGANAIVDAPSSGGSSTVWNDHTGLLVFHTNKCTLEGAGIYVWDGSMWNKISENSLAKLSFDKTYLDLPSGHDARGGITVQELTATWAGSVAPTWTTTASLPLPAVSFATLTNTGSLGASPSKLDVTPNAMTINPTNPWQSKESKLTFTDTECGGTQDVILNQTHFALKVNNEFGNSQIIYTNIVGNGSYPVQGNVTWKTYINDPYSILGTKPAITGGTTIKDGTNQIETANYTTAAGSKYYTADITYMDTESPKRFDDLTVSVLNCKPGNEPDLISWANRLDYNSAEIQDVQDKKGPLDGGVSSQIKNGYQMHLDQDGNLFFSSEFGSAGRWMITNLAAKNYTPTGTRTGDDAKVNRIMAVTASYADDYAEPRWGYPNKTGTTNASTNTQYNINKRLGLLYNWAAASNGRGRFAINGTQLNNTGKEFIQDGEEVASFPTDPQTNKIQGICPNGWHLPSDTEFTILEKEINNRTSLYASMADANGTINIGQNNFWRGSTHGQGMKDPCPTLDGIASDGVSNVMSSRIKSGFNALLAGYAKTDTDNNSKMFSHGGSGYFWSASGNGNDGAWSRGLFGNRNSVYRTAHERIHYFSVRCKKDN